ncbi:MAG TPA: hypothetical protein VI819_01220 [Patescibacteria group bacterium]|nr:hypothetical protein [Patescibacteria group bacterium]
MAIPENKSKILKVKYISFSILPGQEIKSFEELSKSEPGTSVIVEGGGDLDYLSSDLQNVKKTSEDDTSQG